MCGCVCVCVCNYEYGSRGNKSAVIDGRNYFGIPFTVKYAG